MEKDFKEFLEQLLAHGVDFMLVGGFAVALHGFPRFTEDIDVLVKREKHNAEKLMAALTSFGFGSMGLTVDDFLHEDRVVQLGRAPLRIDILTSISGITDYQKLFDNSAVQHLEGLHIKVIALDDLITNKKASRRSKDKIDARQLLYLKSKISVDRPNN